MAIRPQHDWEAIEREYRAAQLSVREIARQFSISHVAIIKRAKQDGWTQNLAARVKEAVTTKLVTSLVTITTAAATVEAVSDRVIQVAREHRSDIKTARDLVTVLMKELAEANDHLGEIEDAIVDETATDINGTRRSAMLRAVALPSRSTIIKNLSGALKDLIALERQAFGLDIDGPDSKDASDAAQLLMDGLARARASRG